MQFKCKRTEPGIYSVVEVGENIGVDRLIFECEGKPAPKVGDSLSRYSPFYGDIIMQIKPGFRLNLEKAQRLERLLQQQRGFEAELKVLQKALQEHKRWQELVYLARSETIPSHTKEYLEGRLIAIDAPKPKFRIGDRVQHKDTKEAGVVEEILWDFTLEAYDCFVLFEDPNNKESRYRLRYLDSSLEVIQQ